VSAETFNPAFLYSLRQVSEAAAVAAYDWIGRGNKEDGDAAAVRAMRDALGRLDLDGTVVIGEGEKDQAPQLFNGERVGRPEAAMKVDIAVDPVEGTSYLAKGLTNAMATIAIAPRGTMFDPGPAFYMEKFAAPPAAKGKIDMGWPVPRKLAALAEILGKRIADLTIYVLEKPRHNKLIADIYAAGARVALYPAGDVAGALMAAIPDSGVDALMGTGGTPEGILSACAIRAMGGEFQGRLDPQLQSEAKAVKAAGLDTTRWHTLEELVRSDSVYFCATGITTGLLFDGVERGRHFDRMQTLMLAGGTGERQTLTTFRRREGGK
jgi:fructose-1,6-bisphosphatase II